MDRGARGPPKVAPRDALVCGGSDLNLYPILRLPHDVGLSSMGPLRPLELARYESSDIRLRTVRRDRWS